MADRSIEEISPKVLGDTALKIIDQNIEHEKNPEKKIQFLKEKTSLILTQIFPYLEKNEFNEYNKVLENTAKQLLQLGETVESNYILGLKYFFEGNYEEAEPYFFESIKNGKEDALQYWTMCMKNIILQEKDLTKVALLGNKINELTKLDNNNIYLFEDYIKSLLEIKKQDHINLALKTAYTLINQGFDEFYLDLVEIYIFFMKNNIKLKLTKNNKNNTRLEGEQNKTFLFKESIKFLDYFLKQEGLSPIFLAKVYELYGDLYLAYKPESKADKKLTKDYYYKAAQALKKELDNIKNSDLNEEEKEKRNFKILKLLENLDLKILEIEDDPNERIQLISGLTLINNKYLFPYAQEYLKQDKHLLALETIINIYQNYQSLGLSEKNAKQFILDYIDTYLRNKFLQKTGKIPYEKRLNKLEEKIEQGLALNENEIRFLIQQTFKLVKDKIQNVASIKDIIADYHANLGKGYFNIVLHETIKCMLGKDYKKCLTIEEFKETMNSILLYQKLTEKDENTLKMFIDLEKTSEKELTQEIIIKYKI